MDVASNYKEHIDFWQIVPMCDNVSTPCTIGQLKEEVHSKKLSIKLSVEKRVEDKAAML